MHAPRLREVLCLGIVALSAVLSTAQNSQPTVKLFFQDTTVSQRGVQEIAVDNTGNVIVFTVDFADGCPFQICGTVVYSVAADGSVNWTTPAQSYVARFPNEYSIASNNAIFFQDDVVTQKVVGLRSDGTVLPNWPVILGGNTLDNHSPSLLIDPVDQSVIVKGGSLSAFAPSTRTAAFRLDGSAKWISDAVVGANNTPGVALGPGNTLYTF